MKGVGNEKNVSSLDKAIRKRKRISKEELHQQDAEVRYSTLVNKAFKLLRKETKVCKTFECQKIRRKIKSIKNSTTAVESDDDLPRSKKQSCDDTVSTSKAEKKIQNLEEKLKMTKSLDLDEVVNVCLQRLGLDPTKAWSKKQKKCNKILNQQDKEEEDKEKSSISIAHEAVKMYHSKLIESILNHKKMVSVVDIVNESAAEHNRWIAREEERLNSGGKKKRPSKKKIRKNNRSSDISAHIADSGLFIDSLAGGDDDKDGYNEDILKQYAGFGPEGENDNGYDYELYTDGEPKKKKNRMGQRERKAKAMALESKKQGKTYDKSLFTKKWYELKPKNPKKDDSNRNKDHLASGLDSSKQVDVSEVVTMGQNWKDEGKAHPSWAARQVQKSKSLISEFKGKKITFD